MFVRAILSPVREYLARFIGEPIKVVNLNQETLVRDFQNNLKGEHLNESLVQKSVTSMEQIMERVECYIKEKKPMSKREPEM